MMITGLSFRRKPESRKKELDTDLRRYDAGIRRGNEHRGTWVVAFFLSFFPAACWAAGPGLVSARRFEIALSEKMKFDIESALTQYFPRHKFVAEVAVELEAFAEEAEAPGAAAQDSVDLPGLPTNIPKAAMPQAESFKKKIAREGYNVKSQKVTLLLEDKAFTPDDINFIVTVVKLKAGIDETRGDILTVRSMPFPPPNQEPAKKKTLMEELRPWEWILVGAILLLAIILQTLLLKKRPRAVLNSGVEPHSNQPVPYLVPFPVAAIPQVLQAAAPPAMAPSPVSPAAAVKAADDPVKVLRTIAVTGLVGAPNISGRILERWSGEGDEGFQRATHLLRSTDADAMDLLADSLGAALAEKMSLALVQSVPPSPEQSQAALIQFRDEFQQEAYKEKFQKSRSTDGGNLFRFMKKLEVQQILHILRNEPPGVVAIALAQVDPPMAAQVLRDLPEDIQAQAPVEMVRLKKIPIASLNEISAKLSVKAVDASKLREVSTDGVGALANILERVDPETGEAIFRSVRQSDFAAGEELRRAYLSFTDMGLLPEKYLSELLRSFPREVITRALMGAPEDLTNRFLGLLPERMRIMISDALGVAGEVSAQEIDEARLALVHEVRNQARAGKIDLSKIFEEKES